MSTVLAIDTSTSRTSVALIAGDKVLFNEFHEDPLAHGEALPVLVAKAVSQNVGIDLVAVGMGPGPFTGLRVGIAFAQSFALGMNVKWHGVCSLDAMAASITERDFIVSTDARRKERFWAHYQDGKRVNEPQVGKASELEKLGLPIFNEGDYFPDPIALAKLALSQVSIDQPIYVRKPDAYPLPANVKFREFTSLDLVPAVAMEKAIYGKSGWSAAQFKEEFAKAPKDAYYIAAESDGELIGYAGIYYVSDFADVHTITVAADHRRKGIGREFLKRLINWARVKKAEAIMLEVRVGNEEALPLYLQNGFTEINRRPNYYGPGLTAIIMRKEL
jgi:tRNA threonylcarbamoyl adenosine modification protein YeaZ/ribosomal-protein-alanine acetyltransferase